MCETVTEKTISASYDVPEYAWEKADAVLKKLARKAKKISSFPISWDVGEVFEKALPTSRRDPVTREVVKVKVPFRTYSLTGRAPSLEGWSFVATVTPSEASGASGANFVMSIPGWDGDPVPSEYRSCELRCDHCNTLRRRKDSFAVQDRESGEWKLVGRNCLADFLGGKDPHEVLAVLEAWNMFISTIGGVGEFDEDDYFSAGAAGGYLAFELPYFLSFVAFYIRVDGWLSRTEKRRDDYGELGPATADSAWDLAVPSRSPQAQAWQREEKARVSDADRAEANKALEWALAEFTFENADNDYQHNVAVALAEGFVTHKSAGLLASVVPGYARHVERELTKKAEAKGRLNEHFGELEVQKEITRGTNKGQFKTVKPRYELELEVIALFHRESDFGTTAIVKMLDAEGRQFVWFGSESSRPDYVDRGAKFTATWSVKKHSEFKGVKETVLTRPTFKPVEVAEDES